MAMQLSVRIQTSKQSKGQAGHDFEERPAYADADRKHLNRTLFGGTESEIKKLIDRQSKSIKNRYNQKQDDLRALCNTPQERKKIGSWRSTTATHKTAIITFNKEFRANDNESKIDREKLDQCALDFFNKLCKEKGCTLTYIVRHDDETTPHYHAMFTNVNEKTLKPLKFQMKDLSALQTKGGEAFSSMSIERGTMRGVRLANARGENPQHENESEDDYNNRIYKIANVKNKSVAELHDTQEKDFQLQIAELERSVITLNNKLEKVKKNISTASSKLESTNNEDISLKTKIEKNIAIYERRENQINRDIYKANEDLNDLNLAQANAGNEVELLQQQILKLRNENSGLIKNNQALTKNNETLKSNNAVLKEKQEAKQKDLQAEIEKMKILTKFEIPADITETYNVQVSLFKHKKMQLTSPVNYNKFSKITQANVQKNRLKDKALKELKSQLDKENKDLQERVNTVKKRESDVDNLVLKELQSMIVSKGLEISKKVFNVAKHWDKKTFKKYSEQTQELNESETQAFKDKLDETTMDFCNPDEMSM